MSQYRTGIVTSAGAAFTLELGFTPDKFQITNYTKTVAGTGVGFSSWIKGVNANATALIATYTAGAPVVTLQATNGYTPIKLGADWTPQQAIITGATNANPVVITATAHGFNNGDTVTISGVVGTIQLNQNRYTVADATTNTFALYDLFGKPVNGTAFGTYVSGGVANRISTPPIAPVLNPTTGQVITPALPPGDFYDRGFEGIQVGSAVAGSNNDILFWEAFFSTPTGW